MQVYKTIKYIRLSYTDDNQWKATALPTSGG